MAPGRSGAGTGRTLAAPRASGGRRGAQRNQRSTTDAPPPPTRRAKLFHEATAALLQITPTTAPPALSEGTGRGSRPTTTSPPQAPPTPRTTAAGAPTTATTNAGPPTLGTAPLPAGATPTPDRLIATAHPHPTTARTARPTAGPPHHGTVATAPSPPLPTSGTAGPRPPLAGEAALSGGEEGGAIPRPPE